MFERLGLPSPRSRSASGYCGYSSCELEIAPTPSSSAKARKFGTKFSSGFLSLYESGEHSDVVVVGPDGAEYNLHMLILAHHSEFFKAAFTSDFLEKSSKRLVLGFDDPNSVWPLMVQYFYQDELMLTDHNVLAIFAMARELMVSKVQQYCAEFAQQSLDTANAIDYLSQAVRFGCAESFLQSCVKLVAEGFPASFSKPTAGLPFKVIMGILTHSALQVQSEEQILEFVLSYCKDTVLPEAHVRIIFEQIRFPYLSNERLSKLVSEDIVPKDLLLAGMATRLSLLDHPEKVTGAAVAPRSTYISTVEYGLPGGSEYTPIPLEVVWDDLAPQLVVRVSGDNVEGDANSVLRIHDDSAWFSLSSDAASPTSVWVEIEFPSNLRVVEFTQLTFSHGVNFANHMFPYGISDAAWFQMKNLVAQVKDSATDNYVTLRTSETCQMQTEYTMVVDAAHTKALPWRYLRISTSDQEGQNRLAITKLKLYGRVEFSLLKENQGKDLLGIWRRKKEATFLSMKQSRMNVTDATS